MTDFDSYIRQGEPPQRERAQNWSIAIGLQAVDGLEPSEYLITTAQQNIEGKITIEEVGRRIEAYYQSKEGRELEAREQGKEEADKVAKKITELLGEKAFVLNVASLANIHRRIFTGVLKHAGEFRTYNITKKEWVLDGDSVIYAPYELVSESLDYDIEQERRFDYSQLSDEQRLTHLMRFFAGIWQIHPFAEGNTRTTAVLAIFYLRKFGYHLDNEPFSRHSLFFRNALVRANYENREKGVKATYEPLIQFFRYLMFGEQQELRNRYLHIRAAEVVGQIGDNSTMKWDSKDNSCTTGEQAPVQVAVQVAAQARDLFHTDNAQIIRLVKVVGTEKCSITEMMKRLGLKHRPNFLQYSLNPSMAEGYIRMLYPQTPHHPRQKYLLTGKGLALYNKCMDNSNALTV